MDSTRLCNGCEEVKPLGSFYKATGSGFRNPCKECFKKATIAAYQSRIERLGRPLPRNRARLHERSIEPKRCRKCKAVKDASEFYTHRASKDGLYRLCKPCCPPAVVRPWIRVRACKETMRVARKANGMTVDEAVAWMIGAYLLQKGACAICQTAYPAEKLDVDHNHATLELRGLLCRRCNHMIGMALDDPKTLMRAAVYLTDINSE